ncbi:AraC family transcriptional regulator [Olivibacter sp. CPCC 100613]|uniref:AraC family transcriptional regulator n=1 Tax=Olivibacter sp. CPCC 100613 TaxID=3079931 RepID=UPI002FF713D2
MIAQRIMIPTMASASFTIRKDMKPNNHNKWHCHEEMEIICIHKGTGMQYIGDSTTSFLPGDIVFIGPNLPHYWRYNHDDEMVSNGTAYSTVLHFKQDFIGQTWLELPEAKAVKALFIKANRGILLRGDGATMISNTIEKIDQEEGFKRIVLLLNCLQAMANGNKLKTLTSAGFRPIAIRIEGNRINTVYNYILQNFRNALSLDEVASVADLSANSFCRYFKSATGKTFGRFLQDVRIGYACRLMLDNKLSVKQICYSCGFKNYTSFHEAFKANTGKTPKAYLAQHGENLV